MTFDQHKPSANAPWTRTTEICESFRSSIMGLTSLMISSVTEVGEIWRPKSQPKLMILYKKPVDTETVSVLRNLLI